MTVIWCPSRLAALSSEPSISASRDTSMRSRRAPPAPPATVTTGANPSSSRPARLLYWNGCPRSPAPSDPSPFSQPPLADAWTSAPDDVA